MDFMVYGKGSQNWTKTVGSWDNRTLNQWLFSNQWLFQGLGRYQVLDLGCYIGGLMHGTYNPASALRANK
jgi:hypothetical protein